MERVEQIRGRGQRYSKRKNSLHRLVRSNLALNTISISKEMRAVNATAKSQEAFAAKEVAALKSEIETLERRLAFNRSGVMGGKCGARCRGRGS